MLGLFTNSAHVRVHALASTDTHVHTPSCPPPPLHPAQPPEDNVTVSLDAEATDPSPGCASPTAGSANGPLFRSTSSTLPGAGQLADRHLAYGTALGVCDSDHKPVWCKLQLQLPAYVQQQKRRMSEQVRGCAGAGGGLRTEGGQRRQGEVLLFGRSVLLSVRGSVWASALHACARVCLHACACACVCVRASLCVCRCACGCMHWRGCVMPRWHMHRARRACSAPTLWCTDVHTEELIPDGSRRLPSCIQVARAAALHVVHCHPPALAPLLPPAPCAQVLQDIRKDVAPRSPPRLTLQIESLQPTMSHQASGASEWCAQHLRKLVLRATFAQASTAS